MSPAPTTARRRAGLAALALALVAGAPACVETVELLPGGDGGSGGTGDGGGSCNGLGPSLLLPRGGAPACAGALAAELDRYALCSCTTLQLEAPVQTDSFDSASPSGYQRVSGAIGTNGALVADETLTLGGALWVAGAGGAQLGAHVETRQSLRVGGPLVVKQSADALVFTDASVAGDVSGQVKVIGELDVPVGAVVGGGVTAGSTVRHAVTVAPPCAACDAAAFPDLARAIADAQAQNDDAAIGLATDGLAGDAAPSALDLPCGRYFVTRISASDTLALRVHGRALLAVMGDVVLHDLLDVTLDPGAELDLVIGGSLMTENGHTIGDKLAPAGVRIWVAGSSVMLAQRPQVGAMVSAPHAAVSAPDGLDLYGSLLGASFTAGGNVALHFDRASLAGGAPCGAAAQPPIE